MNVKELYNEEIQDELAELNKQEIGGDKYNATIAGITQLTDRLIKMDEYPLEQQKLDIETAKIEVEQQKLEEEKKDRKIKNGIVIGTTILGASITIGTTLLAYIFESRGEIITTKPGNKAVDRALNFFFNKK